MSSPENGDETLHEAHLLPEEPPPRPSPTAFSFSGETLQQRHVPVRERLGRAPLFPYRQQSPPVVIPTTAASSSYTKDAPPPTLPKTQEPTASSPTKDKDQAKGSDDQGSLFECNICLDTASQPVVTLCGHLFCWPCIHQWMVSRVAGCTACPVCKSGIDKEKLIPIYSQGKTQDPRDTVPDLPERPSGQRTEAGPSQNGGAAESPLNALFGRFGFGGFQFATTGGNVAFHFGSPILFFPLALQMALNSGFFNTGSGSTAQQQQTHNLQEDSPGARLRAFVSRMMFMLGVLTLLVMVLF